MFLKAIARNSGTGDGSRLELDRHVRHKSVPEPVGIVVEGRATGDGKTIFEVDRLEFVEGQWTCLLGPSGVGKTTLLRLIAGLATHCTIDGSISGTDGRSLVGRVAYMAQDDLLFPWARVEANVIVGSRLRSETPDFAYARRLIERVGLKDHVSKRPAELSGGQKQRVALARTLIENRPVVLLDEPFSSLDARTRIEMQDLAIELLSGRTVLQITHDPAEASRLGQAIYLMDNAKLECAIAPKGPIPRMVDDPETLEVQGILHRQLLGPVS